MGVLKRWGIAEKKDILLNLGSNLSLDNKKLAIMLDFRLQPFAKHARVLNKELATLEPLEIPINTEAIHTFDSVLPAMWAKKSVVRTFYLSIDELIKSLKVACLA